MWHRHPTDTFRNDHQLEANAFLFPFSLYPLSESAILFINDPIGIPIGKRRLASLRFPGVDSCFDSFFCNGKHVNYTPIVG